MFDPLISIIIPVYKVEPYLRKCVDSVLVQTYTNLEIILVDDGSPDNCGKICDEYAEKDKRVKVIHKENGGLPQARKSGFDISIGEYILNVDSDDFIENYMVEKLYDKAKEDNYDIILCDFFWENQKLLPYKKQSLIDKIQIIKNILIGNFQYGFVWNKFFKREIYSKIEFPVISFIEDRVISVQAVYFANKIGYVHEQLYHYMYNKNSLSVSKENEKKLGWFDNYQAIINFLGKKYENLEQFEPELSNVVNRVKVSIKFNKELKSLRNLNHLYPGSKIYILSFFIYLFRIFLFKIWIKKNIK